MTTTTAMTMFALREPKIETPDGVYAPAEDSRLLMDAFRRRGPSHPSDVLDVCTGSGVQAIAAALRGHRVVAVDSESSAVLATRRNAWLNDVEIDVIQGDLFDPVRGWVFDAVIANPPYVPTARGGEHARWCDGGRDGRAVIDRICERAPSMLRLGGKLWMVQSSLADIARSVATLEANGLECEIVEQREIPLGPVSRARIEHLESGRHMRKGAKAERLAVISAKKVDG